MKKAALFLILFTFISKFFGFFRDIALSYFYGASNISDAYLISITIPTTIFSFIGAAVTTSYMPIYHKITNDDNLNEGNKFTSNVINNLMFLCIFIIIFVIIFAEKIVILFASGFDSNTLSIAVDFTKISIFSIVFYAAIYVFNGYLQINDSFNTAVLVGIPYNFALIASIYLSKKIDLIILPYGIVLSIIIQFLIIVFKAKQFRFKYHRFIDIEDENIHKMIYLSMPVIFGISINQINVLVDRTLASNIAMGGISALTYANKLIVFIQGIFAMSIVTVLYSNISKMASKQDIEGLKRSLGSAIVSINILIAPVLVGTIIFSRQIVILLFGRGAFDFNAINLTSSALSYYSIGLLAYGLREAISRVFYSLQDTKIPMLNAGLGMILNIMLNIILSRYLGIGGLALATSIAAIFTTTLLLISLHRKIGPFGMKQISISFLKILFASLIMGGLAKLSFIYLTTSLSQNLSLLLAIGTGAVSYFVIIYFMKIEDVDVIVGAIRKKLGGGTA